MTSTAPNLYGILGLSKSTAKDPNCDKIIKDAYKKKVLACHPDKAKGRPEAPEVFELLVRAYEVLGNPELRAEYNRKLRANRYNDHDSLKKRYEKYAKRTETLPPPTKEQEKAFLDDVVREKDMDISKALSDMKKNRELQDNILPVRVFKEGEAFDNRRFNAYCDTVDKRSQKAGSLQPYTGRPAAWNSFGDDMFGDSGTFLSEINFGSLNDGLVDQHDISLDDLDLSGADYYDNHNKIDDDYNGTLKQKLRDRDAASKRFDSMKVSDYTDDTAGYSTMFIEVEDLLEDEEILDIEKRYTELLENQKVV